MDTQIQLDEFAKRPEHIPDRGRVSRCHQILLLLVAIIVLVPNASKAQETLRFDRIDTRNGLSQNTVFSVLRDSRGFTWFGTQGGLVMYDGYELRVHKSGLGESRKLRANAIRTMIEDHDGIIWIGTNTAGLIRLDPVTESFTSYQHDPEDPNSLSNNAIKALHVTDSGIMLVGTAGGGLDSFDANSTHPIRFSHHFHEENEPSSISSNDVTVIIADQNRNVWVAGLAGLNLFDEDKNQFVRYPGVLRNSSDIVEERISALSLGEDGTLWVGTVDGLFRFDTRTGVYDRPNIDFRGSSQNITALLRDSQDRIWVGTDGNGLLILDGETELFHIVHSVSNPQGLGDNVISTLYEDDHQVVWIGTWSAGAHWYDPYKDKFRLYQHDPNRPQSISSDIIFPIEEDREGMIWIGTNDGLNRFDPATETFHHYHSRVDEPSTLTSNKIRELHVDSKGILWVGTKPGGLHRYDASTDSFVRYGYNSDDPKKMQESNVYAILEDHLGLMWIGTEAGIYRFDPRTEIFTRIVNPFEESINSEIGAIVEDSENRLWIGSKLGGLSEYDRKSGVFRNYRNIPGNSDSLSDNYVYALHEGRGGEIWVGTNFGFNRFDPKTRKSTQYLESSGLTNEVIYAIVEDNQGNLWLTTNDGISRFNPKTEEFRNFGLGDGLQDKEFNWRAGARASNGELYFGGVKGLNRIDPRRIQDYPFVPPIRLTDFQLFNQSVEIGGTNGLIDRHIGDTKRIVLRYDQSVISFSFSALSYANPELNQYAYQLEGFDREWNYVGSRRTATYTNLDPGEYTLFVKGSNKDGVWNEEGTSLEIVVMPPYWGTWWFRLFVFCGGIATMFGLYRVRVHSIELRAKRLREEVDLRTAELSASKNALENRTEHLENALKELRETKDELVEQAHKAGMADIATGALHNIGNVLNSVMTSVGLMRENLERSAVSDLAKANALLRKNIDRAEEFFANDPKGKKLLQYYLVLEPRFESEHEAIREDVIRLGERTEVMRDLIASQQTYAKGNYFAQQIDLKEIIKEALQMCEHHLSDRNVRIYHDYSDLPKVMAQRAKLIHVLVNLFKNAGESMLETPEEYREIHIEFAVEDDNATVRVKDAGQGIASEDLSRIFSGGYTTKEEGHGFGLHSCANYMTEMKGGIDVTSDGPGKGATFHIKIPMDKVAAA